MDNVIHPTFGLPRSSHTLAAPSANRVTRGPWGARDSDALFDAAIEDGLVGFLHPAGDLLPFSAGFEPAEIAPALSAAEQDRLRPKLFDRFRSVVHRTRDDLARS